MVGIQGIEQIKNLPVLAVINKKNAYQLLGICHKASMQQKIHRVFLLILKTSMQEDS